MARMPFQDWRWAACAVLAAGLAACGVEKTWQGPPLNLVVVSVAALRPDHLGCYGHARATSPELDRLARHAFVFRQVQTASPWSAPALVALMTALHPDVHGVRGFPEPGRLGASFPTLAELLQQRGYATAAFTEGGYAVGDFGLDRGFERFESGTGDAQPLGGGRLAPNLDRALAWLGERGREPFFLFLHTYELLPPYPEAPALAERYDADLAGVDRELGRLWRALEQPELARRTVLVVVGDEGDTLSAAARGTELTEAALRVPLVLRLPRGWLRPRLMRDPVCTIDVLPTVLELLAARPDDLEVQGRSLVPLLLGDHHEVPAFSHALALAPDDDHCFSIRFEHWRLVYDALNGTSRLFDLFEDPSESRDVAQANPEVTRRLERWLQRQRVDDTELARAPGAAPLQVELDARIRAELRGLPYAGVSPR